MNCTYTLQELPQIAVLVLDQLSSKTVLVQGAMGAGKTTLIKELSKQLGSQDPVSSPTFSLMNEYALPEDKLFHFDFYRLEDVQEAYDLGIEEYMDSDHWKFIEWPERIASLIPEDGVTIELTKNINGSRTLNVVPVK